MKFVIVGLSHKTAPLDIREKLALSEEQAPQMLQELLQNEDIQEGMLLSTCNRVEAYMVSKHAQRAEEAIQKLFAEIFTEKNGREAPNLGKYLYRKEAEEAIAHLFRVTAGLDSLVVGEPQIGAQMKEAYTQAVTTHATGAYLNKMIHKALNVAKKIRTETGIGQLPVSVSYAAVLLAEKIFGNLKETRVLLIGAGEMGELAAKHLIERDVSKIWMTNRTGERASALAENLGASSFPFDQVPSKLDEVDIVITSTASPDFVIHSSDVRESMRRRKHRPMFFIDISVPRNVDPAVNQIENVYLYDLDHLQEIVEGNLKEREREAKRAEGLIRGEVETFLHYLGEMELSPTIRQLSKKFDMIRKNELTKYLSKHPRINDQEKEALEVCTRAIVNKILHEPIVLMKTEEARNGGPKYSEILKKLFKLEGDR